MATGDMEKLRGLLTQVEAGWHVKVTNHDYVKGSGERVVTRVYEIRDQTFQHEGETHLIRAGGPAYASRDMRSGRDYSMPSPLSWFSSFYNDRSADGGWYGTEVYEIGVGHTVTHSPGKFYVYVEGRKLFGVCSHRFEEMRDAAREMHTRDIPSAEVRFVENSSYLPSWWSRSVVVPLDVEVRVHNTANYQDTYIDLLTHHNLFAGRHHKQEV
jgi:hypothetical protein